MAKTISVTVTLRVKAESTADAERVVYARLLTKLNEWLCEQPSMPPFPAGALIFYNIRADTP